MTTSEEWTTALGLRPGADPELIFWRAKALDRSQEIALLRRQLTHLRDGIEEALEENVRLHKEMNE